MAKQGIRRPYYVSQALNRQGRKTACGEKWDNFTVKYLLYFVFNQLDWTEIPKAGFEVEQKWHPAKRPKKTNPNAGKISVEEALKRQENEKKKQAKKCSVSKRPQAKNEKNASSTRYSERDLLILSRNISRMKPWELLSVWRRCIRVALNEPESVEARAVRMIEHAWDKISYREDEYFTWPTDSAEPGIGKIERIDWPENGLLSQMGYKVGKEAKSENFRCGLLSKILDKSLPPLIHPTYMAEWGAPGSAMRLKKLANTIAAFSRNADRQGDRMALAVEHWQSDLRFLYDQFYVGRFGFGWPKAH